MRLAIIAAALAATAAAAHEPHAEPPAGLKNVLTAPLETAEGLEVIVTDISLPPNTALPRHYHPGEEFVYVLEGSATHTQDGQADIVLRAGDAMRIPPGAVHAPFTMDEPMRAVVFRVHVEGQPERILVEE